MPRLSLFGILLLLCSFGPLCAAVTLFGGFHSLIDSLSPDRTLTQLVEYQESLTSSQG